jgi:hypothetical protein
VIWQGLYRWIDSTWVSQFLQSSTYIFPMVEVVHLIGLTMLLGAACTVCLRLLGFGISRPASEIHEGLAGWTWAGLAVVVVTGLLLTIAEPIKLSANAAFPYKLSFLTAGLLLHFFGYLSMLRPGRAEASPVMSKIVAVGILGCWFGAGVAGRAIGFV